MIVEFVGGSLDGQIRTIERLFEYMTTDIGEIYFPHAINIKNLNWIYLWYEFNGKPIQNKMGAHVVCQ